MLRVLSIALCALVLSACSQDVKDAKQTLTDSLAIPKDVEFRRMKTYPGGTVCGEYSAYTQHVLPKHDFIPFLTVRGKLYKKPTDLELDIFCSKDPAQRLFENSGIGPFTADNKVLSKIAVDLVTLSDSLDEYYRVNYVFPTMDQGLEALTTAKVDAHDRPPRSFPEGGFIDEIPSDPWSRPYVYWEKQWGRTKGRFRIHTLGEDNAQGGGGNNTDVSTDHLQYLRHVAVIHGLL